MDKALVKEVALLLPNVVLLAGRLAMDKRVPWETKTALAAGAAYIVSPVDFIPDYIPFLGQAEDVLVALLLLDGIVNQLDPEIVQEHWRGSPETLERLRSISKQIMSYVPEFIRENVMKRAFYTPGKGLQAVSKFAESRMSSSRS